MSSDPPKPEWDDQLRLAMALRARDESGARPTAEPDDRLPIDRNAIAQEDWEDFEKAQRCLSLLNEIHLDDDDTRDYDRSDDTPPVDSLAVAPSEIQGTIGRFEILRELGRGGFGVVLLARDPNLDRLVALKIPKPQSLLNQEARLRFQREARSAAILSHPAIVPIFESGNVGPIHYIAFEYCSGQTLAQWLANRPEPAQPDWTAKVIRHLAEALQHAHRRGVVHRDLKPGNLLIHIQDDSAGSGQPMTDAAPEHGEMFPESAIRIADFGLAKFEHSEGELPTRSDAIIGTPTYMSPEQARGESSCVDASSDIYALGVIFYEMLTGRPPLKKNNDVETLHAIMHETVSFASAGRRIPRELKAICLKCLAKQPKQRYSTAEALAEDLRRYAEGKTISARPESRWSRAARWCRNNPVVTIASAIAVLAITAGVGLSVLAKHNSNRAERNVERLEQAIAEIVEGLSKELHFVPPSHSYRKRLLDQAIELQQQLLQESEIDTPSRRIAAVRTQLTIAALQKTLGDWTAADSTLAKVADQLSEMPHGTKQAEEFRFVEAQMWLIRGSLDLKQHRVAAGEALTRQAIERFESIDGLTLQNDAKLQGAVARHQLGLILELRNHSAEAESCMIDSLSLLNAMPDSARQEFPALAQRSATLNSLAIIQKSSGRLAEAEATYLKALNNEREIARRSGESVESQSKRAVVLINLANLHASQHRYQESMARYQTATELLEPLVKAYSEIPDFLARLASAYNGLGLCQYKMNELDTAQKNLQRSIDAAKRLENVAPTNGNSRSLAASALTNLSRVLKAKQEFDAALETIRQAETLKRSLVDASPRSASSRYSLAITLSNVGKLQEQIEEFDQALATFEQGFDHAMTAAQLQPGNPAHPDIAGWMKREQIYPLCRLGRHDAALATATEAVDSPGSNADSAIAAIENLARCLEYLGDNPESTATVARYGETAEQLLKTVRSIDAGRVDEFRQSEIYAIIARAQHGATNTDGKQ